MSRREYQAFAPRDETVIPRTPHRDALTMALETIVDDNRLGSKRANMPHRDAQVRAALQTADEALDRISTEAAERRMVERWGAERRRR